MYSPGVSGVACRSSPTRSSPSRMTLMPDAAAMKNDISVAIVMARICAVANSDVTNAFFPPTLASPDGDHDLDVAGREAPDDEPDDEQADVEHRPTRVERRARSGRRATTGAKLIAPPRCGWRRRRHDVPERGHPGERRAVAVPVDVRLAVHEHEVRVLERRRPPARTRAAPRDSARGSARGCAPRRARPA